HLPSLSRPTTPFPYSPLFRSLVTGGGSRIRAMIARSLVGRAARSYITGRDAGTISDFASQLTSECRGTCVGLAADFSRPQEVRRIAADLAGRENELHLLVNNAGTNCDGAFEGLTSEAWDEVLSVNLRGPVFLVRELLPLLRASARPHDPARIVNVGSIRALHVPKWEAHPYGAS